MFGLTAGMLTCLSFVDASISGNLPKSSITNTFPTSYQAYIDKLKTIYPNATFKAVNTNLDWNTVLRHESYEVNSKISTIHDSYGDEWKKDGRNNYVDGSYVTASKSGVAYVLDPRNSIYEEYIFQFEALTYAESIGTDVIEKVLANTLLVGTYAKQYKNAGNWVNMDMSYAEIIRKVGKELNVSSVYIASRMKQETSGRLDTNGSINGSSSVYPGVYNFLNIGAIPGSDGTSSVTNGLKTAKENGWTTPYFSIYGGVNIIKNSYIKWGQDTVYFQKFDVNNPYGNAVALMAYQYQTNILAPRSESINSYNAYKKMNMLDAPFVFYIPVYNNMPADAAPYPAGDSATFEPDNTLVYLDDTRDKYVNDVFKIRSSASDQLDNVIYTHTETKEGAENRTIMTRTKKCVGCDWDYVEFTINGKTIKGCVHNDYVKVYDYIKVTNVSLDKNNISLYLGDSTTLTATVTPNNATFKNVSWTTSDSNVVSVSNGRIEAKKVGTANITVKTESEGKQAVCTVTVVEKVPTITLDKDTYYVTVNGTAEPKIEIKNAENYTLEIQNITIAKIEAGKIKGIKLGETFLTARITGQNVTKQVAIKVVEELPAEIKFQDALKVTSNKLVSKVGLGVTAKQIKEKVTFENLDCKVVNPKGEQVTDSSKISTGTKLQFVNKLNQLVATYTIVVYGDINGDGSITTSDILKIVKHLYGTNLINNG